MVDIMHEEVDGREVIYLSSRLLIFKNSETIDSSKPFKEFYYSLDEICVRIVIWLGWLAMTMFLTDPALSWRLVCGTDVLQMQR